MKKFLKLFRLSDLCLAIGFIFFLFFLLSGYQLMDQYKGPIGVWFPIWVYAIFFGIIALSWGYYIFLEIKAGYSPKRYINIIFIFLAVFAVIVIFLQPIHISEDVICRMVNEVGDCFFRNISTICTRAAMTRMKMIVFMKSMPRGART